MLKSNALFIITHLGHEAVAKVFIRNGANINAVDDDKMTPLHSATRFGKYSFKIVIMALVCALTILPTISTFMLTLETI